jgi:alcohol dehydrogenase
MRALTLVADCTLALVESTPPPPPAAGEVQVRMVTCGATPGAATTLYLMQLFQQQYRIIGSFGASMRNIRESLAKMAAGIAPVIDTEFPLAEFERGLAHLESRAVFGKIAISL